MSEREKIVVWLRHQRDLDIGEFADGWNRAIEILTDRIDAGEHLKRPEPTVPASEWIPKSNLQQ